jgi:hypothetical protein
MMIRITGLVAWYVLVGDVICGTMISGGVARITIAYPRKFLVHRILGWALLAAVAFHISFILYQHYKGWGFWQIAVPSPAGPLGRNFGVVATWLLVVILALAMFKTRIPKRQWHWIHRRITFGLLAFGTTHGVLAGSVSQGTQLPVILPAVVALTLWASVCLVRLNVTATRRRTRAVSHGRHVLEKVSLSQRYWPKIASLATFHLKEGDHVARPTRKDRQARSMRIMFGLVAALCVSVLIAGADQFGVTGLRAFVARQGGVGATPDTKDCGHLSACTNPGLPRTPAGGLVAASAHRQKSRKRNRAASSAHSQNALSGEPTRAQAVPGSSAAATGGTATTTPVAEPTATLAAQPTATSSIAPAIRRITTTTSAPATTTTTSAPATTTTTSSAPTTTTTTAAIPNTPLTTSNRRSHRGSSSRIENGAKRRPS